MEIGVGPKDAVEPVRSKLVLLIPENKMTLEVYFNFTNYYEEYFIYVTMPYSTSEVEPYARYNGSFYYSTNTNIGTISSNFENFTDEGSSAIKVTLIPNENFTFSDSIGLAIEAKLSDLVSIEYPFDFKHTLVLTLFGGQGKIWNSNFMKYTGFDSVIMAEYPFQAYVQFPQEYYLSSDTFPTPFDIYVTEGFKSAEFNLEGTSIYPEWRGETISCSYINPTKESEKNFITFLSGTIISLGITALFQSLRELRNGASTKMEKEDKVDEKNDSELDISDEEIEKRDNAILEVVKDAYDFQYKMRKRLDSKLNNFIALSATVATLNSGIAFFVFDKISNDNNFSSYLALSFLTGTFFFVAAIVKGLLDYKPTKYKVYPEDTEELIQKYKGYEKTKVTRVVAASFAKATNYNKVINAKKSVTINQVFILLVGGIFAMVFFAIFMLLALNPKWF